MEPRPQIVRVAQRHVVASLTSFIAVPYGAYLVGVTLLLRYMDFFTECLRLLRQGGKYNTRFQFLFAP